VISLERAKKISESADKIGIDATAKEYDISQSSVERYVRVKNKLHGEKKKCNARILVFDIETAPDVAATFGIRKQYVSHKNLIREWHLLTFVAKWMDTGEMIRQRLTPEEALRGDDKRIAKVLWELVNEADIVIAHNGDRFDIRKMNARFWYYDFEPPNHYKSIDTYKEAMKVVGTNSHKLDYLAHFKGHGEKMDNEGMPLWKRCIGLGDDGTLEEINKAISFMLEYNEIDVEILELLYIDLRPWMKKHPNIPLYDDRTEDRCRYCGSEDIVWEDRNKYLTNANVYSGYRCLSCGAVGRSRNSMITPNKRKSITR